MKKRIKKEFRRINKRNHPRFAISTFDIKRKQLSATLLGPPGSLYEDGVFYLEVTFPTYYPFQPPLVEFRTKIFHPQLLETGEFHLGTTCWECGCWAPAMTLEHVIWAIDRQLMEPDLDQIKSPFFEETLKKKPSSFPNLAKKWTKLYAT